MHIAHANPLGCLRALVGVLAVAISAMASAGHYQVSYSGGFVSQNGSQTPYPSGVLPNGTAVLVNGDAVCSGKITATLTWMESFPGEPTPPNVVVMETAGAAYEVYLGGGTCSSGISGETVDSWDDGENKGDYRRGTRYTVKQDPPAVFTVDCSPNAGASGVYTDIVSISYLVVPTIVDVRLSGTTMIGSTDHILVGQNISTSIEAPGFTLKNYTWSIGSGTTSYFHHAEWGAETPNPNFPGKTYRKFRRAYGPPSPLWFNEPSISYFYDAPGRDTITCSATLMLNGVEIGQVQAERALQVDAPEFDLQISVLSPNSIYLPNATSPNKVQSSFILFQGSAETPTAFRENGLGFWSFTQLVSVDRLVHRAAAPSDHLTTNGAFHLDNTFPYKETYSADGLLMTSGDRPEHGLSPQATGFRINDLYWLFNAYQPPSVGKPVEWVPLEYLEWAWSISGTYSSGSWPSPPTGGTYATGAKEEFPSWRFQWNDVVINQ